MCIRDRSYFTDGWNLNQADATIYNSTYDTAVKNAYNLILASVPASPPAEYLPGNVQITVNPASSTGFLPYQPTQSFTVRLTKGSTPLVGYTVTVRCQCSKATRPTVSSPSSRCPRRVRLQQRPLPTASPGSRHAS